MASTSTLSSMVLQQTSSCSCSLLVSSSKEDEDDTVERQLMAEPCEKYRPVGEGETLHTINTSAATLSRGAEPP
ncbi:UNVERIFIED_CONTAM: hypothetical protein Sradi_7262000 [Sesamum radiatum]|uniref:Uncharacterized protein n=1 Tax=Sesamum radiatum TaxID=300843 RepID=A0AAW2IKN3_SESRA